MRRFLNRFFRFIVPFTSRCSLPADMFIDDTPIKTEGEDILGRGRFVTHLSNALVGWRQSRNSESIVIALCGKWGSGKSSIINLVTKNIGERHNSNKPTIIRFNPWEFSKKGGLIKHFFNEISRKLEINNDSKKDKKTAKQLRLYAKYLELLTSPINSLIKWFPISSIALSPWLIDNRYIPQDWHVGEILFIIGVISGILLILANYLRIKTEFSSKSASELKKEITDNLSDRKGKIIVVIDDIDRLNQSEIKQIFQLIKINADFPNTIYLLSLDREIVEKNLSDVQRGVSGKDYMDKMVQMCFDIPVVKHSKVWSYFEKQLKRVLNRLPKGTTEKYFSGNYYVQLRRANLEPELKNFIKNIRDVKRFINGLEFNLLQMHLKGHMEVNVIDFIAIEAIRMFVPSFYSFMKQEKTFFTSILNDSQTKKTRIEKVREAVNKIKPLEIKGSVSRLIEELFPQIYSSHTLHSEIKRSSVRRGELRVCEREFFDKYFTLLPGGGEDELSQYEIKNILHSAYSAKSLKEMLAQYIGVERIDNAVMRIGDFANDEKMVPQRNIKNIMKALFDVSDNFSGSTINICYKFLERENSKDNVLEMLKEIIPLSEGLYWPVELIYYESEAEAIVPEELIVPKDKMEKMREICVERIESFGDSNLLKNKNLEFIMHRWHEWSKDKKMLEKFIEGIQENDEQLLALMDEFITEQMLFRKHLLKFFKKDKLEEKLKKIIAEDSYLYRKHKKAIDLYFNDRN